MIREALARVVEGEDLSPEQARGAMADMMSGSATQSQMAAFVTAMRMKGETEQELLGFATEMRANAVKVSAPQGAVDLCGTGGDGKGTLNISTIASFVVASAGVPVAKHGNRSVSSMCGSADLLGALGIPYDLPPRAVEECMRRTGFGFMFAPVFHRSTRNVMPARREIGIRTFFNILGPMCSPASVDYQLMGVYDPELVGKVASVLRSLGSKRAMVVHGSGTDEITNAGETVVAEVTEDGVMEYALTPEDFGVEPSDAAQVAGGTPDQNARAALRVLKGDSGPWRDVVLMNAAAALYVSGKAKSLGDGMALASAAVSERRALAKLREFAAVANSLEAEAQSKAPVADLRGRRLAPDVMRTRCAELAEDLEAQIGSLQGGREALLSLDQRLLRSPNILSVLTLRRLHGILSGGAECRFPSSRAPKSFSESLASPGVSIIGEYKPRSPTLPPLAVPPERERAAEVFSGSGIAAVSVLQEPEHFGGSQELFAFFRSRLRLPILFKDFVVTDQQIDLAGALGADAVLLIAKALDAAALDRLLERIHSHDMEALFELHDQEDIRKLDSLRSFGDRDMLGVNCRDLSTLEVSLDTLNGLRSALPEGHRVVAESGVRTGEEVSSLKRFDALLVGSALMRAEDMKAKAEELVSAGRRAAT